MTEPSLPDKVLAIDRALTGARVAHAFGGAFALAYYAEPRATIDIDVNAFVAPNEWPALAEVVTPLGVETRDASPEPDGQCRWWWGRTPIDLFFSYAEIHEAMAHATRRVPFGDTTIPILGPEHLIVCKVVFDRVKDWLDVEQVLVTVSDLERPEIERHLDTLLEPADPRRIRYDALAAR